MPLSPLPPETSQEVSHIKSFLRKILWREIRVKSSVRGGGKHRWEQAEDKPEHGVPCFSGSVLSPEDRSVQLDFAAHLRGRWRGWEWAPPNEACVCCDKAFNEGHFFERKEKQRLMVSTNCKLSV